MREMWTRFWDYVSAVIGYWQFWVAVAFWGERAVERYFPSTWRWAEPFLTPDRRRRFFVWIAFIAFAYANFQAFEAAELRAEKAEAELTSRSQAENRRKDELRDALRRFYVEATDLINEDTHLPVDISNEELSKHSEKVAQWMNKVYQWAKQNLGDPAAATLTEGQPTMNYGAAHGSTELNNLLNGLFSFRDDIRKLIESNMWDAAQK